MRKILGRGLALMLGILLLAAAVPVSTAAMSVTGFPDVPEGVWYENALHMMQTYTPGIINGYDNEQGTRVFGPEGTITRGGFLKMIMVAAEGYTADKSRSKIHWAGDYYTMALENNVLVANVYDTTNGVEVMFPCTWESLNADITRYEMAVIINNVCTNMLMERPVLVDKPEENIPDYAEIPTDYVTAVEQAYGKGLLTGVAGMEGYTDGSFAGDGYLTRSQAAVLIYRLLWSKERKMASFATEQPLTVARSEYLDPSLSFANWLRQGHVDSYGNIDAAARLKLFGDANKKYFRSASEAAPYMETVTVPIWVLNKTGGKDSSTVSITVNKAVAAEVRSIFQMIYDDPEQFPIYGGWSAGGARYSDTMRHSWGCAIDINALYNCECNTKSGYLKITCGYGWWPLNRADSSFAGSMSSSSRIYSIGKNESEYGYSVVKAFATYGWGWGGNGWSSGRSFDFMHFSVLPSGG